MPGALDGLRVIDCSEGIAGPMAALYLADFGADVVKVEPAAGDRGRLEPGFPFWNRNKRGITADFGDLDSRRRLRAHLRGADVCLFSQPLGELERLGFDPLSLQALNPALVYLHLPAYTAHGPGSALPESAALLCAETGVAAAEYSFAPVPVDPVIPHVLYGQAIWAATCIVAALTERQRSGHGQTVTVGGLHGMLVTSGGNITRRPEEPVAHSPGGPGGPNPYYRLYQCGDGEWLFLAGLTPAFHTAALAVLGVLDRLLVDPRLEGELMAGVLPANAPWVIEIIAAAFRERSRADWLSSIRDAGCPCGPVQERAGWFDHPQVAAIGMRLAIEDPERGHVAMPGLPLNLTATPASVRSPAPTLGQHDATFEGWAPRTSAPAPAPLADAGPLAGTRVLDLGAIIAGTYAGSLLADLGADVIKVEPPGGDSLRGYGPTFVGYNLGKRSLCLDLRKPAGRDVFYRLVQDADVVVDNYRPGVLQRLQVDYAALKQINPRIVCVTVTGYGEGGPLSEEPGFDPLLQAASGMMQAQGGDAEPVFYRLPVNDVATAATAALGAVLALFHRGTAGEGQRVWTSLAAQSLLMQSGEVVRFAGRPPVRRGGRDFAGPAPLDRYYQTLDGWVRLQATAPAHVEALHGLGFLPEGKAPAEASTAAEQLAANFAALSCDDAVERLRLAGVPAAAARTFRDFVHDPQVRAADGVQELTLANGVVLQTAGRYAQFSRSQATGTKHLPGLGEHSDALLAEAGYSAEDAAKLAAAGVVRQGGPFLLPPL